MDRKESFPSAAGGKRRASRRAGHTGRALAELGAVILLSACSGFIPPPGEPVGNSRSQPASADERANAESLRTARTAAGNAKRANKRMTAQDIMLEWGTLPLTRRQSQPPRSSRSASLRYSLTQPQPAYSQSIQEIMADAACASCAGKPYHDIVQDAANRYGLPASLIHAVIATESSYNPGATSSQQARGLMQLTPDTGRAMGVRNSHSLYDPKVNIHAGTAYLKYLMSQHDTIEEVLAAYNAGSGNVRKYGGVPPFKETIQYVNAVKKHFAANQIP